MPRRRLSNSGWTPAIRFRNADWNRRLDCQRSACSPTGCCPACGPTAIGCGGSPAPQRVCLAALRTLLLCCTAVGSRAALAHAGVERRVTAQRRTRPAGCTFLFTLAACAWPRTAAQLHARAIHRVCGLRWLQRPAANCSRLRSSRAAPGNAPHTFCKRHSCGCGLAAGARWLQSALLAARALCTGLQLISCTCALAGTVGHGRRAACRHRHRQSRTAHPPTSSARKLVGCGCSCHLGDGYIRRRTPYACRRNRCAWHAAPR